MKRKTMFILSFLASVVIYSQEESLIHSFINDLFDVNVLEEEIVSNYLVELKNEKRFTISLEERNKNRLNHIITIRQRKTDQPNWLTPSRSNCDIKNTVASYKDFKHLDTISWAGKITKRVEKMYVLIRSR